MTPAQLQSLDRTLHTTGPANDRDREDAEDSYEDRWARREARKQREADEREDEMFGEE